MSTFIDAINREVDEKEKWTRTENGEVALKNTGDACMNFFAVLGALRDADWDRVVSLYEASYAENPLLTTRMLFYARDTRGGLGERKIFRDLINHASKFHPESIEENIALIPEYGRFDDWYSLVGTPLESTMFIQMHLQFLKDMQAMKEGRPVSLLAKWMKSCNTSASPKTRELGERTATALRINFKEYRQALKQLRHYIDVTECKMSEARWGEIDYSTVPSYAMKNYRVAFQRNDQDRFHEYLYAVQRGEKKINSSTLYPYDLIRAIWNGYGSVKDDVVVEEQWKALPNYIPEDMNALVMADVSGSMTCSNCRPLHTSIGLATYFAERNKGAFHNLFMTFSAKPEFIKLEDFQSLAGKVRTVAKADWGMNTNLELAFEKILNLAVENRVPSKEMPKALIIISDMEIDESQRSYDGYMYGRTDSYKWTFYDRMKIRFEERGYEIPHIIFWNVASRHDVFHADANRKGVTLVSGQSSSTFASLMNLIGMTPYEAMVEILSSERYSPISIMTTS